MIPDPWQIMDDWCREQGRELTARSTPFVMKGGSLNDPEYRRLLGQHQAFGRMRSFIHGARNAQAGEADAPKDSHVLTKEARGEGV